MTYNDLLAVLTKNFEKYCHGIVKPEKFSIQNCTCRPLKLHGYTRIPTRSLESGNRTPLISFKKDFEEILCETISAAFNCFLGLFSLL